MTADLPDAIATERLTLRRMTHDESLMIAAGAEPPTLPFAPGYPHEPTLEVAELFTGPRSAEMPGFVPLVMIRRDDGRAIGDIGYTLSRDGTIATVGYDVNPLDEGRGYATEALRGLTVALFAIGVRSVRADTYADHVASRRVMEKAGMSLVRERTELEDSRPVRMVDYEIVSDRQGAIRGTD